MRKEEGENEWRRKQSEGTGRVACRSPQEVKVKKRVKEGGVCQRGRVTWGAWCSKNHWEERWMQAGGGEVR